MKILVVEDSKTSRMYLIEILKDMVDAQTEISYAATGEEAFDKFLEQSQIGSGYDLIFMDIILPGMDGLQTLEKIRAFEAKDDLNHAQKSKAIITTALDDATKASRAFFQCEAISYITKPITTEKIQTEMAKFGLI